MTRGWHRGRMSPTGQDGEASGRQRDRAGRTRRGGDRYRLVVIEASVVGVTALGRMPPALPADFPIPVAAVPHRTAKPPDPPEMVLARRTRPKVKAAEYSEPMRPGTVDLAPPDLRLKLHDNTFVLADGRKIRCVLASANLLFASAAGSIRGRVIAVVLTGSGQDATDGVRAFKARGGHFIAQDEETSEHFSLPRTAIEGGCADRGFPFGAIGHADPRPGEHARGRGHRPGG